MADSARRTAPVKFRRHLVAVWVIPLALGFLAGICLPEGGSIFPFKRGSVTGLSRETEVIDAPAVGGPVEVPLSWLSPHDVAEEADASGKSGGPASAGKASLAQGQPGATDADDTRRTENEPSRGLVIFSLPPTRGTDSGTVRDFAAQNTSEQEPSLVNYVVKEGDTLSSIAASHRTTVASIAAINGLDSPDRIIPGQHLMIVKNASALVRRVAKGDTLWEIARAYGVTVESIAKANSLSNNVIIPGQLLIIPVAQIPKETWVVASVFKGSPLEWPVLGRITSGFGWRIHPISGVRDFHEGIDIAAAVGTPVRAVAAGKVIFAGYVSGYGRMVTIDHGNGLVTRYAHLSRVRVSQGQTIPVNEVIGYVGDSGYATGPHLHFEVRMDGEPKDPLKFLR